MKKIQFFLLSLLFSITSSCATDSSKKKVLGENNPPNIILIYTDDVGYGDIGIYGGEVPTPNIDALAHDGLMLTNAYASSATCTPSRFSLLTGEYAWRKPGRGVALGDAAALIRPEKETLPLVMQRAGYATAVIGKWHLGLGGNDGPDWNGKITPGPLEIGFDYSFIIPATGDRVPTVYVENHHIVGLDSNDPIEVNFDRKVGNRPTGLDNPELLTHIWTHGHNNTIINGISRIGYMKGGESALWRDEDFADIFVDKASYFIDQNSENPFFLFFSTQDIHVPRIPHERFQGSSEQGFRGDAIVQMDWTVGALMQILEEKGLRENTMVVFSSDNGPVLDDGYADDAAEKLGLHDPFSNLRGGKYSAYEAGTKIPLIVSWPSKIKGGQKSDALFSQIDMLASFAALTGQEFDQQDAMDSHNYLKVLLGEDIKGREVVVQEALRGNLSLVRSDGYKYIAPSSDPAIVPWGVYIETGFSQEQKLFNLRKDPQEIVNIAKDFPEITEQLMMELNSIQNK